MRTSGLIEVDPKSLRVNIRYLSNSTVPKIVRDAMNSVKEQVAIHAAEQGWKFIPKARYGASFIFCMEDRRADLDGPSKRTIDAVVDGLMINDGHIDELHFFRSVGEPSICYQVWTLDIHDTEDVDAEWYLVAGDNHAHKGSSS